MLRGILRGPRLVDDSGVAHTVLVRGPAHRWLDLERAPVAKEELRKREGATDVSSREHLSREQVVGVIAAALLGPLAFSFASVWAGANGGAQIPFALGLMCWVLPAMVLVRGVFPRAVRVKTVVTVLGAGYCPVCWADLRVCAPVDRGDGTCGCLGCGAVWRA